MSVLLLLREHSHKLWYHNRDEDNSFYENGERERERERERA